MVSTLGRGSTFQPISGCFTITSPLNENSYACTIGLNVPIMVNKRRNLKSESHFSAAHSISSLGWLKLSKMHQMFVCVCVCLHENVLADVKMYECSMINQ